MKKTEIVITTTIKTKKNLSNSKQTDMKLNKFVKSKTNYTTINEKKYIAIYQLPCTDKTFIEIIKKQKKRRKTSRREKD